LNAAIAFKLRQVPLILLGLAYGLLCPPQKCGLQIVPAVVVIGQAEVAAAGAGFHLSQDILGGIEVAGQLLANYPASVPESGVVIAAALPSAGWHFSGSWH
jgi:hypothetical protein